MTPDKLSRLLRDAGLKSTPKRRMVAQYLLGSGDARTVEDIHRHVRRRMATLGLPTVYRIVEELAEIGLLVRIDLGDRVVRYAACSAHGSGHHHHIVCVKCGSVGVIPRCAFHRQVKTLEQTTGFRITGHRLHVEGMCPKCQ
ncbi:MAG TPA: Fur family transcriptional regulator [bacterium]|nr:Fur family transcriptional regulator [bacterium]